MLLVCLLTLSILEALGFRRRRRWRLIKRVELCSVELLNLKRTTGIRNSKRITVKILPNPLNQLHFPAASDKITQRQNTTSATPNVFWKRIESVTPNHITIQTMSYAIGYRPCPLPVFFYFAVFREKHRDGTKKLHIFCLNIQFKHSF